MEDRVRLQNLATYVVPALPKSAYYVADFLSREEEEHLLQSVLGAAVPAHSALH